MFRAVRVKNGIPLPSLPELPPRTASQLSPHVPPPLYLMQSAHLGDSPAPPDGDPPPAPAEASGDRAGLNSREGGVPFDCSPAQPWTLREDQQV